MVCSLRIAAILRTTNGSCGGLSRRAVCRQSYAPSTGWALLFVKGRELRCGMPLRPARPAERFLTRSRVGGLRLREKHSIAARQKGMIGKGV